MLREKHLRIPKGFRTSSIACGIKGGEKKDLALFFSDVSAVCAGTFTKNRLKSGSVIASMNNIKYGSARALIVNSGNANALTGKEGIEKAERVIDHYAKMLKVKRSEVLIASTGVIGIPFPDSKIIRKSKHLIERLSKSAKSFIDSATAIMTTDSYRKITGRKIKMKNGTFHILALVKGAGMINPSMATMLCFVFTDLKIPLSSLKNILKDAVHLSFNRITVDGDTSTNDTVIAMANGLSGISGKDAEREFASNLKEILKELALSIVKDGEGATRVFKVIVEGAKSEREAEKIARCVGNSLLVKTMVHGGEPNFGRIMAAAGASGVPIDIFNTSLEVDGKTVVKHGRVIERRKGKLKKRFVEFKIRLDRGKSSFWLLASDLTENYIKLNAGYMT